MELVDLRHNGPTHEEAPNSWEEAKAAGIGGPWLHSFDYPYLYHRDTDKLYVGPFGWAHLEMLRRFHPEGEIAGDRLGREYLQHYDNPGWGTGGRIKPDGTHWYTGQENEFSPQHQEITQHIKSLFPQADPWREDDSDFDWHTSAVTNLTIQEIETGHGDPMDPVWGLRRPFIVKDGVIYMGDPGSHHPWIAKAIGSDMYYNDDSWPGFVWMQPSPDAYEGWFAWHKEPPEPLASDAKELIAETYPQYVWGPGQSAPEDDYDWSTEFDSDEDEPYGVLSGTYMDTNVEEYYKEVARKSEQYLAEGEPMREAIDLAFGMVDLPRNYPGDPGSDPTDDEIALVKNYMGRNLPKAAPDRELEHVYKPAGRDSDYYRWRVPVNYYPDSGQVVTGDPGDFHGDLYLPHGGRSYTGMIGMQGREGPEGQQYTPGFTWLDQKPSPAEHKAVIKAIAPHWPEAVNKFQEGEPEYMDEDDWSDWEVPLDSRFKDRGMRLGFAQANGINMIQVAHDPQAGSPTMQHRVPFIYHHDTNSLIMGHPGYFHHDIKQSPEYANTVGPFPHPATEGWAWTEDGEYDFEEPFPDERTHQNVKAAVEGHLGQPLTRVVPFTHDDWADLMEN